MKAKPVKLQVNTTNKSTIDSVNHEDFPHLPHDRDEKPDDQRVEPQEVMKQAHKDLQRGLVDTDMHGERGVEEVVKDSVRASRKKSGKIIKSK